MIDLEDEEIDAEVLNSMAVTQVCVSVHGQKQAHLSFRCTGCTL